MPDKNIERKKDIFLPTPGHPKLCGYVDKADEPFYTQAIAETGAGVIIRPSDQTIAVFNNGQRVGEKPTVELWFTDGKDKSNFWNKFRELRAAADQEAGRGAQTITRKGLEASDEEKFRRKLEG
ncbi:hypothetical protein A2721_01810 [Candidatus Gottesmanbacteria bacterium RIFCSPHIGHO2_01_FULL_47_48]|uniref:Uncharacterized protein n=1 Tax=Candidatus Gottesmanbacteria bacterium RIFCSPHIGHO2_01_FULL_47_48 TaxID=1798381 RepID=A0A1F6A1G0_9BACT|nr:MAG: hypothetical protein A2721_01810 [Candidatus Gottesmanbacteria bacterium RIFCSPHIGHO2_01_FULL_47_48]